MKDYYKILGIDKNASQDDIKKAFKKAAIKYHPDKFSKESKEKQKEAEEKFKEINEAYNVLSDEQKRKEYDNPGYSFNFNDMFNHFNNMNNSFKNYTQFKAQAIYHTIFLNINEIFNGCHKKFKYNINDVCDKCNGEGGFEKHICHYCSGTGMINETKHFGATIINTQTTCQHCHGDGYTFKQQCDKCHGLGYIKKQQEIELDIPKHIKNKTSIIKEGVGNKIKSLMQGDVVFIIEYNLHDNIKIQNDEVFELIEIPYYDCLLGTKLKHKLASGKEVEINIPENTINYTTIPIKNEGLNGSNYNIVVNMKFNKINNKEKEYLNKIKELYK